MVVYFFKLIVQQGRPTIYNQFYVSLVFFLIRNVTVSIFIDLLYNK